MTPNQPLISRQSLTEQLAEAQKIYDFSTQGRLLLILGDHAWLEEEYSLAQGLYGQAWAAYEQAHDQRGVVQSMKRLGDFLHEQAEEESRVMYDMALTLSRQIGDKQGEAHARLAIGKNDQFLEQEEKAKHLQQALELFQSIHDEHGEADALKEIGWAFLHYDEEVERVHTSLSQALALYEKLGDQQGEVNALDLLADHIAHRYDFTAARPLIERLMHLHETMENHQGQVDSLLFLGRMLRRENHIEESRATFEQVIALSIQYQSKDGINKAFSEIDALHYPPNLSQDELESRLDIYRRVYDQVWIVRTLMEIGHLIRKQKGMPAARPTFQEAIDQDDFTQAYRRASIIWDLARMAESEGDISSAQSFYEQTLALHLNRLPTNPELLGHLVHAMSQISRQLGDEDDALTKLWQAAEYYGKTPEIYQKALILQEIADIELKRQNYDVVRSILADALVIFTSDNYARLRTPVWWRMAELEAALNHDQEARQYFQQAWADADKRKSIHYRIVVLWKRGQFEWSRGHNAQGLKDCAQALTFARDEVRSDMVNRWFPIEERQHEFDVMMAASNMEADQ